MDHPKFLSRDDIQYVKKNGSENIGSGSFGQVRLIKHRNGQPGLYALKSMKILDQTEKKYIMQEIQLHAQLKHPFIIQLIDYFLTDHNAYVVLEYASKGDLFRYLHRSLITDQNDLLRIFVQTLMAFEHMHAAGIIHRDLKPENILLDGDMNAKVCDFGWSAEYNDLEERQTLCGTAEYMAPEVMYGKRQTKKTDIWALGKDLLIQWAKGKGGQVWWGWNSFRFLGLSRLNLD